LIEINALDSTRSHRWRLSWAHILLVN